MLSVRSEVGSFAGRLVISVQQLLTCLTDDLQRGDGCWQVL
jgi:hypothetical protein